MPQAAATATAEMARATGDAVMEEVNLVAAADLDALVRDPQRSVAAARAVAATRGGN